MFMEQLYLRLGIFTFIYMLTYYILFCFIILIFLFSFINIFMFYIKLCIFQSCICVLYGINSYAIISLLFILSVNNFCFLFLIFIASKNYIFNVYLNFHLFYSYALIIVIIFYFFFIVLNIFDFRNPHWEGGFVQGTMLRACGGVLGRLIHRGRTLRPSIALLVARRNVW